LKEERFVLTHGFRGFSLVVGWLHALGQNIMVRRVGVEELFTSWWTGSKEREKERERKGLGARYNLQWCASSDPLSPTRPCLLKFPPLPKTALPVGDQAVTT
jgi:hypothetical protein